MKQKILILASINLLSLSVTRAQSNTSPFPASGSVGIGTTQPTQKLEVVGNLRLQSGGLFIDNDQPIRAGGGNQSMLYRSSGNGIYLGSGDMNDFLVLNSGGTEKLRVTPTGKVGIGTSTPDNTLDVRSTGTSTAIGLLTLSRAADVLRLIDSDGSLRVSNGTTSNVLNLVGGYVGIGISTPGYKLDVRDSTNAQIAAVETGSGNNNRIIIGANADEAYIQQLYSSNARPMTFKINDEKMRIDVSGNVGIGTTNPTQKLSVNGTVRAKEVIVETTGWSDYVFADDYVLQPLNEVEKHIKTHKHLPGVPSAQQVAENGVGLGEMQASLLAKIEELTLHQIEQEKVIRRLNEEVGEIPQLRAELSKLRK